MFICPIKIIIGGILILFIYINRLESKEIFSPSNKIHRKVDRAKDLPAPRYVSQPSESSYENEPYTYCHLCVVYCQQPQTLSSFGVMSDTVNVEMSGVSVTNIIITEELWEY